MLTISINWEYFLGIIGTLIALSYYANGRFTRIETNFEWLADAVRELTIKAENLSARAFDAHSPVSLTESGEQLLRDSGLKSYIDRRKDDLTVQLRAMAPLDLYTVQENAFRLFHHIPLEEQFARQLKRYAFRTGTSTDLLRRVGAIYLRDVAIAPHYACNNSPISNRPCIIADSFPSYLAP
jgi:hypothetical protein